MQIEECNSQVEELIAQQEQYPSDDLIQKELEITLKLLLDLTNSYQTTITYISGVEWLLEP